MDSMLLQGGFIRGPLKELNQNGTNRSSRRRHFNNNVCPIRVFIFHVMEVNGSQFSSSLICRGRPTT